ncbi:MAG: 30S ribosomal protein S9 [Candidatus Moraniibacteriota bacterium]
MNKEEKTTTKKAPAKKETKPKKAVKKDSQYFYAVGRRKTSVAQVRIYPSKKVEDKDLTVNAREMREYFPGVIMQSTFEAPLRETGLQEKFKVSVLVQGGGINSQVEAIRLGIARALIKFDETLRPTLKANGFLSRDSRKVERKKAGLKKARRAPQFSKR